jgi:hypothetical protein
MNGLVWWSAIKLAKAASRISRDQPSSIHPIEIARYTA